MSLRNDDALNHNTITLALTFPQSSFERLKVLAAKSQSTEIEVISNALRIYEELINRAEQGSRFVEHRPGGHTEILKLFE